MNSRILLAYQIVKPSDNNAIKIEAYWIMLSLKLNPFLFKDLTSESESVVESVFAFEFTLVLFFVILRFT